MVMDDTSSPKSMDQDWSEEDNLNEESSSELPSFNIELFKTGNAGSQYRTQNDPASVYERRNIIERKGSVNIKCSCLDVVHG